MKTVYQGQQMGDVNCSKFTFQRNNIYAADGSYYEMQSRANFGEISFAVNGQADCKTKMDFIEALFFTPYGDLLILNDDGSATTNSIANSATKNGVKPGTLTWSDAPGAQFTTWRSFSCDFSWEQRVAGLPSTYLVDFTETVSVSGGTPLIRVQEPINVAVSSYDEFMLLPKQKYVVTQSGRAVGLTQYYTAPPLYPNPMMNPTKTTTPSRLGTSTYEKFVSEWSYSWEFGTLAALPIASLWPY